MLRQLHALSIVLAAILASARRSFMPAKPNQIDWAFACAVLLILNWSGAAAVSFVDAAPQNDVWLTRPNRPSGAETRLMGCGLQQG